MKTQQLISYLKVFGQNIRTLHRHLIGGNWMADHEKLAEYYEKIDDIEDAVVEAAISSGQSDISIKDAISAVDVLDCREYTSQEAFSIVQKYFIILRKLFEGIKEENIFAPGIISEFESFEYWLYIEAEYKLKNWLSDK